MTKVYPLSDLVTTTAYFFSAVASLTFVLMLLLTGSHP
jgi:hypothetical protein